MGDVTYQVVKRSVKDEHSFVDGTEMHEQERVALACLRELFLRTQLPCSITHEVEAMVNRYGAWAALATSSLVIGAFEAGKAWGRSEREQEVRKASKGA